MDTKVSTHYDKNFTGLILENSFKQKEIKLKREKVKSHIQPVFYLGIFRLMFLNISNEV